MKTSDYPPKTADEIRADILRFIEKIKASAKNPSPNWWDNTGFEETNNKDKPTLDK